MQALSDTLISLNDFIMQQHTLAYCIVYEHRREQTLVLSACIIITKPIYQMTIAIPDMCMNYIVVHCKRSVQIQVLYENSNKISDVNGYRVSLMFCTYVYRRECF